MKNSVKNILLASFAIALVIISCKKEDENAPPSGSNNDPTTTNLRVLLTDAPGDYKAVYVDIEDVEVLTSDSINGGWNSLDSIVPGIFDLIKLSNGLDTLLGSAVLPAGRINQIRLILGDDNSVVLKNGDSIQLKTPSAQQSGLKIQNNVICYPSYK